MCTRPFFMLLAITQITPLEICQPLFQQSCHLINMSWKPFSALFLFIFCWRCKLYLLQCVVHVTTKCWKLNLDCASLWEKTLQCKLDENMKEQIHWEFFPLKILIILLVKKGWQNSTLKLMSVMQCPKLCWY